MTSYLTSIDTFSLSRTVFEIFDFKVFRVWPWPLEVTWGQKYFHHLKAHTWLPIQLLLTLSLYLIPLLRYLTSKFSGFYLDLQRLPGVKNISTIRKPIHDFLSNCYWHFLSISYRFWDIRLQSFQGLTLTFRSHLRSKIFSPFESPYMTSYPTSIDTFSLSHTAFEIFDFKVFRVWPWPSAVTWSQKYFHHSKAHTWLTI